MRPREVIIALSLANLFFLGAWAALQDRTQLYYRKNPPDLREALAVLLNVVLAAAVILAGLWLARRVRRPWARTLARCVFLASLAVPLRNISAQFPALASPLAWVNEVAGRTAVIAVAGVALLALIVWNRRAAQAAAIFLLIMSPLLVMNVISTFTMVRTLARAGFTDRAAEPIASPRSGPRVVVLLFDELDYRLAFAQRPAGLHLPELDRLRAGSVFASNATSAQWETVLSVPSMLTGREVRAAAHTTGDELVLAQDGGNVPWNRVPNIFWRARAAGFRTALAGWYHPYCRVLGASLDSCFCETGVSDRPEWNRPVSLRENMWLQLRRQLAVVPVLRLFRDSEDLSRPEHRREYLSIHQHAVAVATDGSFGLVFLHYPVPHPPGMFNPATGNFDVSKKRSYADNLPLVDRALGQLRAAMERAGVWDTTTLIVTSDHPFRVNYWPGEAKRWGTQGSPLVPFLIKLAGQTSGGTFAASLNTRLLHDLTGALLAGEVRTQGDLLPWLTARSGAPQPQAPETVIAAR